MGEIRNKIITISGEPKSGKSTVIGIVKEKYEKRGFNVHVISIGQLFRDCMKEEWAKVHPERPNTNLADMQEDESFAPIRSQIDTMLDKEIVEKKGKEINSKERPNDVYIVDARLAWKNIPESFAIRLTIDERIAGERAFLDKDRGSEDEYETVEEAREKTKQRKLGEISRYKEIYGVDITEPENYNLIANTSYCSVEELADIIIAGEEAYREGEGYPKNWASPACFLPLQLGRITGRATLLGNTIESLADDIRKNGYDPYLGTLEILEKDGNKYLLEGNHRAFGALSAGKTLLPYEVVDKDGVKATQMTAIDKYQSYMEYLYDYAEGIGHYGGGIGNIEQLKEFTIDDLLSMQNLRNSGKMSIPDRGR